MKKIVKGIMEDMITGKDILDIGKVIQNYMNVKIVGVYIIHIRNYGDIY